MCDMLWPQNTNQDNGKHMLNYKIGERCTKKKSKVYLTYFSLSGSEPRPRGSKPRSPGNVPSKYFGASVLGSHNPRVEATAIRRAHAGRGRPVVRAASGTVVPTNAFDICVNAAMVLQCCFNATSLDSTSSSNVAKSRSDEMRISRRYALHIALPGVTGSQ